MGKKKNFAKIALVVHKKLHGKIEIASKAKVRTKDDLSTYYTPGVGAVSSYLAEHKDELRNYTLKRNSVAVVSDGSAVLGLGNIGPEGALPVMEGKCMLFKTLADVDAFPLVLATQDPEEIISTVKNIAPVFGGINLEDIAAPKCFAIEERLRKELDIPVLHDDQHGTAMVVLAGLLNAVKVVRKDLKKTRVVIAGSGAAGQAIAKLLSEYGVKDILMVDSRGIVGPKRTDLDAVKQSLLRFTNQLGIDGSLLAALQGTDIFIGVSKGGTVTGEHIRAMAPGAIVFALANPIPEIMPDLAERAGAAVFASGRSDFPNQINNSLGFPGIFRGALDHRVRTITQVMLIQAAENLARLVKRPTAAKIIPHTFDKGVVEAVSRAIKG